MNKYIRKKVWSSLVFFHARWSPREPCSLQVQHTSPQPCGHVASSSSTEAAFNRSNAITSTLLPRSRWKVLSLQSFLKTLKGPVYLGARLGFPKRSSLTKTNFAVLKAFEMKGEVLNLRKSSPVGENDSHVGPRQLQLFRCSQLLLWLETEARNPYWNSVKRFRSWCCCVLLGGAAKAKQYPRQGSRPRFARPDCTPERVFQHAMESFYYSICLWMVCRRCRNLHSQPSQLFLPSLWRKLGSSIRSNCRWHSEPCHPVVQECQHDGVCHCIQYRDSLCPPGRPIDHRQEMCKSSIQRERPHQIHVHVIKTLHLHRYWRHQQPRVRCDLTSPTSSTLSSPTEHVFLHPRPGVGPGDNRQRGFSGWMGQAVNCIENSLPVGRRNENWRLPSGNVRHHRSSGPGKIHAL